MTLYEKVLVKVITDITSLRAVCLLLEARGIGAVCVDEATYLKLFEEYNALSDEDREIFHNESNVKVFPE